MPSPQQHSFRKICRFLLAWCAATTTVRTADAWSTSSAVSSFAGSVLLLDRQCPPPQSNTPSSSSLLTMKKGKANVPPSMRGQYEKQREMMAVREQMLAATKPGADGYPVFNLFVRTKRANVRYNLFWIIVSLSFVVLERSRVTIPPFIAMMPRVLSHVFSVSFSQISPFCSGIIFCGIHCDLDASLNFRNVSSTGACFGIHYSTTIYNYSLPDVVPLWQFQRRRPQFGIGQELRQWWYDG